MNADEIISRLCKLQAEVYQSEIIGSDYAADCFCGKSGFWSSDNYDGTYQNGYRNDGKIIEYIEIAVRERIAKDKAKK